MGFTVLLGDLDRNDQATIDPVGFVLVRPDDELVVAVRDAVAEMLAHHPVQVRIFKPAVFAQKRIESLALVWIGRASGNGLTHFLQGCRLVCQDVIDGILGCFGANRAIDIEWCVPAGCRDFLANIRRTLAHRAQSAVHSPP